MPTELESRIATVRGFNRFYTQRIGVLRRRLYDSPLALAEIRVLYELAHRDAPTATELAQALALDAGYLSRILRSFERRRWISRQRSTRDARQSHVALTAAGRKAFDPLDRASHDEVAALLTPLTDSMQARVIEAMRTIQDQLDRGSAGERAVVLRTHRPGDIGWVVQRHGEIYAQDYGWDETFEGLVAEIAAKFIRRFDVRRERCWIAELNGERVGSVFVVKRTATIAQLRLLLVEPAARGLGIGKRLVDECLRFARASGYRRMMLWTNGGLDAARAIYEARGFVLTKEERHRSFGKELVGQTFELVF